MSLNPFEMYTDYIRGAKKRAEGLGSAIDVDPGSYKQEHDLRQGATDQRERLAQLYDQMSKGGYDQGEADRYYNEQTPGIDKGYSDASEGSAAAYARRGLGNSGSAAGAQQDASIQAAALRRQARMRSIDAATSNQRQRYMDQINGQLVRAGSAQQESDRVAQDHASTRSTAGRVAGTVIGGVGGFLVGGPAGAAIGAGVGGSAGSAIGGGGGGGGGGQPDLQTMALMRLLQQRGVDPGGDVPMDYRDPQLPDFYGEGE